MVQRWRAATVAETTVEHFDRQKGHGAYAPTPLQAGLIGLARRTFLKRGKVREQMARAIFGLRPGPLDISFRGAKFRLRNQSNLIEYGVLLHPGYNATDIDFLLEGAPEEATYVDIGSNIGLYALSLAAARPRGRVIAIDANPAMTAQLSWNAGASRLAGIEAVNAGVSDADGWANLSLRRDDLAIAKISETEGGKIPVRRLADLLEKAGVDQIYGLKIDVEGHEDKALVPFLDGAQGGLLPQRIVIETPDGKSDYPGCTAAFARHGYALQGRTRNNSLYRLVGK